MTIDTGISPTYRTPSTIHRAIYQKGGSSLVPIEQLQLLVGQAKGGTALAGSIYQVSDAQTSRALFGAGTSLDLMVQRSIETGARHGRTPFLYATPLDEPGGGTAATATIVFAVNASTAGAHVIRIAGRSYTIAVAVGDTPTTQGAALAAAINADPSSPVTAVNVAGTVTTTYRTKGVNGNDIKHERVPTNSQPGATTVTIAAAYPVNGAGVSSIVAALAASAGIDFDVVSIDNHAAQDVTDAKAHTAIMWGPTAKKWRRVVMGENGTSGVATALWSAVDDLTLSLFAVPKAKSTPGELAAAFGTALANRTRPNANWDNLTLPLFGPDFADVVSDFEQFLSIGVSPGAPTINNFTRTAEVASVRIVKAVTAAQTLGGFTSEVTRDVAVPNVANYFARQVDRNWAQKMGADANPDGVLDDDDSLDRVRLMVDTIITDMAARRIVRNAAAAKASLVIERDPDVPGRVNIAPTNTPVVGMHQLVCVQRISVGG